jgi:hypothetical protein
MKKIYLLILTAIFLQACSDLKQDEPQNAINYTSQIDLQRVELGKTIASNLKNKEFVDNLIDLCNAKLDLDKEVLVSTIIKPNSTTAFDLELSDSLIQNKQKVYSSLKTNKINLFNDLVKNDPLVQIHFHQGNSTETINGVVVLSTDEKNNSKFAKLFTSNGEETTIGKDIVPNENYFIISKNERSNKNWEKVIANAKSNKKSLIFWQPTNPIIYKPIGYNFNYQMKLVSARFANMDALRSVEGWWWGDPEVRLNVFYAEKDQTGTWVPREALAYFSPGGWTKNNWWIFDVFTTDNVVNLDLPLWKQDQSTSRIFKFYEEDSNTPDVKSFTANVSGTNQATFSWEISGNKNDEVNFASSNLSIEQYPFSSYNWGIINVKFN